MKNFDVNSRCHKAAGEYKNMLLNNITMKNIKKLNLSEVQEYTPAKIIYIRKKVRLSQAALAKVFNISPSAVRQWEVGDKKPSGASKKLFELLERKGLEVFI